jgi:hypothetical protein
MAEVRREMGRGREKGGFEVQCDREKKFIAIF